MASTTPDSPDGAHSVSSRVQEAMPLLSSSERKVARSVLSDYPRVALGTVSRLASAAEVSTATVVRFCTRVGFNGFSEFHDAVRDELSTTSSPVSRALHTHADTELAGEIEHRAELVRSVLETVPAAEVERLIDVLCDSSRTAVTVGGRLSQLASHYLQLHLRHIRPRVLHLADPLRSDLGAVLDITKRDLIIVFDFRRYEARTQFVAETASQHGATVALITDTWLSPIASIADIVLPLRVEASFLDSFTAVFALIESIVPAVAARLGDRALNRMSELEALRDPLAG